MVFHRDQSPGKCDSSSWWLSWMTQSFSELSASSPFGPAKCRLAPDKGNYFSGSLAKFSWINFPPEIRRDIMNWSFGYPVRHFVVKHVIGLKEERWLVSPSHMGLCF